MEVGAAVCLGVVVVEGSLVVAVVAVAVEMKASLACSEALGSACPCSSVSLRIWHLEPLE